MIATIAAIILAQAATASPEPSFRMDGKRLLSACTSRTVFEAAVCAGYVSGVQDALILTDAVTYGEPTICMPLSTETGTLINIVVAQLQADPSLLSLPGATAAYKALNNTYACPAKPK